MSGDRGLPAPAWLLKMMSAGGALAEQALMVHGSITHVSRHPFWVRLDYDTALVMGNSPAMGSVRPGQIPDDVLTIGVNRALRHPITPKVLMVRDEAVLLQEWARIAKYVGAGGHLVVCSGMFMGNPGLAAQVTQLGRNVALADVSKFASRYPSTLKCEVMWTCISPPDAIQLAAVAGCKRIGLIGVDLNATTCRASGEPTHFFGDGIAEGATGGPPLGGIHVLQKVRRWALEYGVEEVTNLSPVDDSPFTVESGWPRATAEEFLGRKVLV